VPQTNTAKLFRNGASQAVRLPAEFRFEGSEVFISRDESTGDVILSARPGAKAWRDFFAGPSSPVEVAEPAPQFLVDRPMNQLPEDRELFRDAEGV
jgi:antitoxin VapB